MPVTDFNGLVKAISKRKKVIYLLFIYDAILILIYIMLKPNILVWFFDDAFVKSTGLFHYIDFRPGYPPLGKLPYTLIYNLFTDNLLEILLIMINMIPLNITIYFLYSFLDNLLPPLNAKVLTLIFALNPSILFSSIYSMHADFLALLFLLLGIYAIIEGKTLMAGVLCGLGFLTKVYPVILLFPTVITFYRKGKSLVFLSAFLATVTTISAPFLALDPLMYLSVFTHHTLRGPSESIFALLDGYYSHTGFPHPTYEATIYSHQFALIHQPSRLDHFRYSWNTPYLRYISSLLQLLSILYFSLMASRVESKAERTVLTSITLITYFAFSSFWNPLVAIPVFLLTILATLRLEIKKQILLLAGFSCVDIFHHAIWNWAYIINLEFSLTMVVSLRAILLGITFFTASTLKVKCYEEA